MKPGKRYSSVDKMLRADDHSDIAEEVHKITSRPLNVSEFASLIGYHPGTVRRLIRAGRIKAVQFGKQWRIPQVEVGRILKDGLPRSGE